VWTFATKNLETHAFGFLEPVPKQVSPPGLPSCFGSMNRLVGNLQSCAAPRCELRCGTFPYLSELGRELPELPVCHGCGIKTDSKQQCCPRTVWLTYKMEVEGSRSYPKPVQLILFFLNMFRQLVGIMKKRSGFHSRQRYETLRFSTVSTLVLVPVYFPI